jgi:hypothetical protein
MSVMETTEAVSDSTKYEILIVPEAEAEAHLETVKRLIAGRRFHAPVLYTPEQLIEMVAVGRMQLWLIRAIGEKAPCLFMVTEIMDYPAGRSINICLAAGSKMYPAMRKFFPMFLIWCQRHHADYIECTTLPSISKILMRMGFSPTGVRLHYPLVVMQ